MQLLKRIDLAVQLLAFIVTTGIMIHDGGLFAGWVALGAAQVLSCGVNLLGMKKQYRAKGRRGYEVLIAIFIATIIPLMIKIPHYMCPGLLDISGSICVLIVLASPALAFLYFAITITEMLNIGVL